MIGRNVDQPLVVADAMTFEQPHPTELLNVCVNASSKLAPLVSGRSVVSRNLDETTDLVEIRSPEGKVELEVFLTAEGPVLRFLNARLQLSSKHLTLHCEHFEVDAQEGILQRTQGDYERYVQGETIVESGRQYRNRALEADISSTRGDVRIKANDDVRLNGERVKLNC
jgi:hypothetical protein